ncbi:phasin family protein [Xylella taiwanensis]|uniref:Phasin family protein n=1 Tax=Xylella taiwanensis TaxID=1444770 RepID=Z9JL35_9GAMM|nr:phasin family protein [Xylella taiwanensis]AXI83068.1 poly(hydroxyalcanoate) granule associated protein [Xylella taiwanensis]EWS78698.1 poly(hydroxyalcanoate) granule associated protein [Xylella taiwanensis]MCD8456098.1 phasin family protein [Xylella taiwanensis]MCD8458503.1 phasin family protein [Xylella taiwanensis]MCD8460638.1 phasin family protein [Xylella taiwanensis]
MIHTNHHEHTSHQDPNKQTDGHDNEEFTQRLGKSAEQIWLAGLGALGRVQSEGARVFEALVHEGEAIKQRNRESVRHGAENIREQVEVKLEETLENTQRNWRRMNQLFDERIQGILHTLKIPSRDEIEALRHEIEMLRTELRNEKKTRAPSSGTPDNAKPHIDD